MALSKIYKKIIQKTTEDVERSINKRINDCTPEKYQHLLDTEPLLLQYTAYSDLSLEQKIELLSKFE